MITRQSLRTTKAYSRIAVQLGDWLLDNGHGQVHQVMAEASARKQNPVEAAANFAAAHSLNDVLGQINVLARMVH